MGERVWIQYFFNDTATTEIYTLSLHDALPISVLVLTPDDLVQSRSADLSGPRDNIVFELGLFMGRLGRGRTFILQPASDGLDRKKHTSELQSRQYLVCRLLLEKKKPLLCTSRN